MPYEKKNRTSQKAVNKFNKKTYDIIAVRVPKEMAQAFKAKCAEEGTPQAQVIKGAIQEYLDS